jgi:V-ATPase subunit C
MEKQKKEAEETISSEREQQQIIIRLAKTNFSEVFSSWVHLKALRIFVESVLRYGLPPDFTSVVIEVGSALHILSIFPTHPTLMSCENLLAQAKVPK